MAIQLKLNPRQVTDLAAICGAGPENLQRVATHLADLKEELLRPDDLENEISSAIPELAAPAEALMRTLIYLRTLIIHTATEIDDILPIVLQSLQRDAKWPQDQIDSWEAVQDDIKRLVSTPIVKRVAAALDLSYEHPNLLRRTRILTDIRPLYSDDATEITGAVVSHTLQLRYFSADGDHELSVSLDNADIETLAKQCRRASVKSKTARNLMAEKGGVQTIVSGETRDD